MKRTPFCHKQRHCFPNKHSIHLVKSSHYLSLWIWSLLPRQREFEASNPSTLYTALFLPHHLSSVATLCNRLYFSDILDLQNDSRVMQIGSFAEIRIHHKHCFTGLGPIFFLQLFATISLLPNPFLSSSCSCIQTPFPVALVWLEFILSFSS